MEPVRTLPPNFDELEDASDIHTAFVQIPAADGEITLNVKTWWDRNRVQTASSTVTDVDDNRWPVEQLQVNIERCPTASAEKANWVKQTCGQSDGKRRHVWGRMRDRRLSSYPEWVVVHVPVH